MTLGAVQVSTDLVKLTGPPPFWSVKCYGSTMIGGAQDRPILWRDGKIQFASIGYPLYGHNQGWNFEHDTDLVLTATGVGDPDAVMTGVVQVREAWHRDGTHERSWVGAVREIDLGSTPSKLTVSSNSFSLYDRNITHRVFYVNYVDTVGTFYEAALVEYTTETGNNTDTVEINVSPEVIIFNRPLEDKQQTLQFPAVKTAVFWKGRVWGGGLEPRSFKPGTKLTIHNGTNLVTIEPSTPGGSDYPDFFIPGDVYKGIVDRDSGKVVAYIRRVVHSIMVEVSFPGNADEDAVWPHPTTTRENVGLSGNMANIYSTPIYAGGAGGAIIQGIMTWCPLDMLQDENFYASGAELIRLTTAGDELCVIYDRGIGFYAGDVSAGSPPQVRAFIAAKNIGSFNPTNVWQAKDGTTWFEGGGRLYVIKSGQVVEASKAMGIAAFWERNIQPYGDGLRRYQAGYNPQRNMALLVNLPKAGEDEMEFGTYAVAVCHDSQSVHPLRFHQWTKMTAIHCIQHDDGNWQFYAGTGNRELYKIMVRGQKFDRRIADSTEVVVPVEWQYTTGVFWVDGMAHTVGVRLLIETDATGGVDLRVEVDAKLGNLNSGTFVADAGTSVEHSQLDRLEWIPLHNVGGYALQYKVSGATQEEFKLVHMTAIESVQQNRVMG